MATVELNGAGQRLLKSRHSLAAKLTATSGSSVLASQTLALGEPTHK